MLPDAVTVPHFPRAADYGGVWAVEPGHAAGLWDRARTLDLARHVAEHPAPKLRAEVNTLAAPNGQAVAVVVLGGVLMKQASSMDASTSTVQARRELRKAAADPAVGAVQLMIDSPGGSVSGTAELAAEVRAAAKAKPVFAFCDDLCASAAYWVASQCDRVYANQPTALVGSIGTLSVVYDVSGMAEKAGVKPLVFRTGPIKGVGTPGEAVTDEQQAYYQGLVDTLQGEFDAGVRAGRRLSAKQLAAAKTGGVFPAAEAQSLGLIDGVKPFEAVVAELSAEAKRRGKPTTTPRATSPSPVRSAAVNEFEQFVTARGFDPAALSETMTATLRTAFDAEQRAARKAARAATAADPVDPVAAQNAALRASLATGVAAANPHAGPTVFTRGALPQGVTVSDALTAALCLSVSRGDAEARYARRPEVLEAADAQFRGVGLGQVLMMAAAANGYHARPGERVTAGNLRPLLQHAFPRGGQPVAASGFSTVDLPGILSNVGNTEILAGYLEDNQEWREVAQVKSVSNFQQITSYRLLDDMEYEEVAPAGKIKHGSLGEESYTRQAKTYAKMFKLTRPMFINDDLGAFQDIRTRLGRGSAKKLSNLFWATFMANSGFFTAGRGNYITGSTTNLGLDGVGLQLGLTAFRQLKSSTADGAKRVGGRPTLLVVPPELEFAADRLYAATNTGAGTTVAETNIHAGKYKPVVVPWLSDPEFPGYSTTAWYLFRSPADLAAAVVSFLDGNPTPVVESADADFDELGVQFRGYHDFGVDLAEWLAGIKAKGAA